MLYLLLDDPNDAVPPSITGAQQWKDQYGLTRVDVFPDPNFAFVPGNSVNTPQLSVYNPRTSEVTHLHEGLLPDAQQYAELLQVAAENKALWSN
ncbi:hypothetical protein JYT28_00160 [Desulfobulbus sp. AH-315-M07]|nr:hypothetical protein [Desulfobulbus sp. AH-315-M07]